MNAKPKIEYALYFSEGHVKRDHDQRAASIHLNVVVIKDGLVRNPSSFDRDGFADFRFSARIGHCGDNSVYGWQAEYEGVSFVDYGKAEVMLKHFKKIEKAYKKITVRPVTFGKYVAMLADKLGIKQLVQLKKSAGWSYDDSEHTFHELKYAADIIDHAAQKELDALVELNPDF